MLLSWLISDLWNIVLYFLDVENPGCSWMLKINMLKSQQIISLLHILIFPSNFSNIYGSIFMLVVHASCYSHACFFSQTVLPSTVPETW